MDDMIEHTLVMKTVSALAEELRVQGADIEDTQAILRGEFDGPDHSDLIVIDMEAIALHLIREGLVK